MNTILLPSFIEELSLASLCLADPRPRAKFADLGLAMVCGQKPKTITSGLDWLDQTREDWSGDYRLFSQTQWETPALFASVFRKALQINGGGDKRLYVGQDDTLVRKRGRKIPGVSYARDPLGPPFQVNLVLGQRFVQTSVLLQPSGQEHPWRAVPVQFTHAPVAKIPRTATDEEIAAINKLRKKRRLSVVALTQLQFCRQQLNQMPQGSKTVLTSVVDGGYANSTYLAGLPANTGVLARFRKDARLREYLPPEKRQGARKYGPPLPTPLEMLQDPLQPWMEVPLFIAGQTRTLKYKELLDVCWPREAKTRPLRLILIKTAGYRLLTGGKLLYRDPAFLITTDLSTPAADLIAAYLARWEIEVNFRD